MYNLCVFFISLNKYPVTHLLMIQHQVPKYIIYSLIVSLLMYVKSRALNTVSMEQYEYLEHKYNNFLYKHSILIKI